MKSKDIQMENSNIGDQLADQVPADVDPVDRLSVKIPADDSDTDEGFGGKVKPKSSKTTRRVRRKTFKPYYQLSEGERNVREEREKLRVAKLKERMWAKGRIIAPYNTTQFLMADQPGDDFYYSASPADDHDFICNEFRKEYEVHNINRLEKMSKEMLLNEYMLLEQKNEKLEEKLKTIKKREEAGEEPLIVNTKLEYEYAANRMRKMQSELEKLKIENERLLAENFQMKRRLENESESEESSDAECSTSSSETDMEILIEEKRKVAYREIQSSDDPGYESNQSKGEVK